MTLETAAPAKLSSMEILRLCDQARNLMHVDLNTAISHVETAYAAAMRLREPRALAEALRMRGHVSYLQGKYPQAARMYRRAIAQLERLGDEVDLARTLSSALQTLIYLGAYEEALAWAARARDVFEKAGDHLRLARLDSNTANILQRQDRNQEALSLYRSAVENLRALGDHQSAAIALRNQAVCCMALHEFDEALAAYSEAGEYYRTQGLTRLAAEVTDNIAYLYQMQGDYTQALAQYRNSGVAHRGNTYHYAISELDQSDLYLELNLFTEAARLAQSAAERLSLVGTKYEQGKALLNWALAACYAGSDAVGLAPLTRARRLFRREQNANWVAIVDLYRGAILLDHGRPDEARRALRRAHPVLAGSSVLGKAVLCSLLLARLELAAGRLPQAQLALATAEQQLVQAGTAPLRFEAHLTAGEIAEATASPGAALEQYTAAHRILESLRGQLPQPDIKAAFLKRRQLVYQHLVRLTLQQPDASSAAEAWNYVEQAKSRTLAESLGTRHAANAWVPESPRLSAIRRRLHALYHRLERLPATEQAATHRQTLREQVARAEEDWTVALTLQQPIAVPHADDASHLPALAEIQSALGAGDAILEYFEAGSSLYLFVLRHSDIHVYPLGDTTAIRRTMRLLAFQLSRATEGVPLKPGDPAWLAATQVHLRTLYRQLVQPAQSVLPPGHWTIVPHGWLFRLPFHALHDGSEFLIDQRSISYAPSAAVDWQCRRRDRQWTSGEMIFGVADERAPSIRQEVRGLAALLPQARLFEDQDATLEALRTHGLRSRVVHLAAHGLARQDNPLFSAIRLHDSRLCAADLYGFEFAAELVTLSGCTTGVHETIGAGEIAGLARGFLHAGAHAVQVTLWDIGDRSTADYMTAFYSHWLNGSTIAESMRRAMIELRRQYPHPYYWAPFAGMGRVQDFAAPISSAPRSGSSQWETP